MARHRRTDHTAPIPGFGWSPLAAAVLGATTLILETVWMRGLGQALGSGARATAATVAAFFLTAAVGGLAGAKTAASTTRPGVAAGSWLVAGGLLALVAEWFRLRLLGALAVLQMPEEFRHPLAALALCGPAFLCLAAAWPAVAAAKAMPTADRAARAGWVQAADLLGAALGAIAAGACLPGLLGLSGTACLAAGACMALGVVLMWTAPQRIPMTSSTAAPAPGPAYLGWILATAAGVLTGWGELAALAECRQFGAQAGAAAAAVLAAILFDLSLGAVLAARWRGRGRPWRDSVLALLLLAAIGAMTIPVVAAALLHAKVDLAGLSPAWQPLIAGVGAALVLAPLFVPAGGILPLSWDVLAPRSTAGSALGRAYAINLAAAGVAALAWPFGLPVLGLAGTVWMLGGGYLLTAILVSLVVTGSRRMASTAIPLMAGTVALALWLPPPPPVGAERVLERGSDPAGEVAVVEDRVGSRHLVLDNSYQLNGTGTALTAQRMETWLPLLLVRNPQRVAWIGMASGIGAAAALDLPVSDLQVAEVVEGVASASRRHFMPWNAALWSDPRAHVQVVDGRRLVLADQAGFDAVIVTLLRPIEEGAAGLWSRDFLVAAAGRLRPGGVLCLWLPVYQCDRLLAEAVIRTFLDAFPCAVLVRANYDPLVPAIGLIGSQAPLGWSTAELAPRLSALRSRVGEVASLREPQSLRMLLVGDLRGVAEQFADGEAVTDDRPLPAFHGPVPWRERLLLIPLLDWMGTRFLGAPLPSCDFGATEPAQVRAEMRAGNWQYAAACWDQPIPGEPVEHAQRRAGQAEHARAMVRSLVPGLKP